MTYFSNNEWGKNQYQNLNYTRNAENSIIRTVVKSLMLVLGLGLLVWSLWSVRHYSPSESYVVAINTTEGVLHTTNPKFLSFGLDSSLLRDRKKFPIDDERFATLARWLSPAWVRVGGTSADCLFFNKSIPEDSWNRTNSVDGNDISNFTLSPEDFLAVYTFTDKAQLKMLFDLNVLIRETDGNWDDTNAMQIINFARGHNMQVDWQLGNEPNSFRHAFGREVTAQQLAKDYYHLRQILNENGYAASMIIGPEVNHIGDPNHKGEEYAKEFLENCGDSVDWVSWHQYYLNGREAQVKDFVDPLTFNYLPLQIKSMAATIKASGQQMRMWLSETSTAYGGGAPDLSDRFVAGFLWLDKLGLSALSDVAVVVRQSFFGGDYAMVGPDLNPNPDWWVSVMYKQLVSQKVLRLIAKKNFENVRLYAHCTPDSWVLAGPLTSSITVFGMNLDKVSAKVSVQIIPTSAKINMNFKGFLYILTSDYLKSRKIRLNGKTLKLSDDGALPALTPIRVDLTSPVTLPAYSMAFIVIPGVNIPSCDSQEAKL